MGPGMAQFKTINGYFSDAVGRKGEPQRMEAYNWYTFLAKYE